MVVLVCNEYSVRLRVSGARQAVSETLQQGMAEAEAQTANNTGLTVGGAVNYGGQWDIAEAARQVAKQAEAGVIQADQSTDHYFSQFLQLADLPPVDLLIRAGGECRVSNFVLLQLAYSVLYFSSVLFPDFDSRTIVEAIN